MQFNIVVTRECINMGERGSPVKCPIARAVRKVAGVSNCSIGLTSWTVWVKGVKYFGAIPPNVANFISRFDQGVPSQPDLAFELQAEPEGV